MWPLHESYEAKRGRQRLFDMAWCILAFSCCLDELEAGSYVKQERLCIQGLGFLKGQSVH